MDIGACPHCSRPYSAADIVGFGILRPRVERAGGPLVEYTCPGCDHRMRLIPYGEGRYAIPGSPPPPPVPEEERRPPWLGDRSVPPSPTVEPDSEPPAPEPLVDEVEWPTVDSTDAPIDDGGPLDVTRALAILGCSPTADRRAIERAFRDRSLTCHPDKVAHLDPEFQELAERKFKRLRAARDLLLS